MSDVRDLLEQGVEGYAAPDDGLARARRRMKRRQRNRKIATIAMALAIAGGGVGLMLAAFEPSGTPAVTPVSPVPPAQRALVMQLRPVEAIIVPGNKAWYRKLTVTCGGSQPCTAEQLLTQKRVVLLDRNVDKYRLGPVIFSGVDVVAASAVAEGAGTSRWVVTFRLSPDGTNAFSEATGTSVANDPPRNQIAIVVGGRVISAPAVQSQISGGAGQITNLTRTQAAQLAGRLAGA